ncbi:hypothetical protein [Thermoanaerobacterium sp. RBIITD]|uniref:hypothetical protein n=1 Tax=Thermoanaerobacterium sp. RBIITD TaxID=1550240 RepID=UPI000BB809B3|nr:hypothetical protein [Thermoanaerobacterium sp. RBIITD]SNX54199.1 hypothetical protein SAMN05660242_1835 [Thermoanaerobacterium sp. RBIITD]
MLMELWGCDVWIVFSDHAFKRVDDRNIVMELIPDSIKSVEEELGDVKINNDFVIINTFANITIVGTFEKQNKIVIKTIVDKGDNFIPKENDIIIKIS